MTEPQWEACKVCGGDHWTKDHPDLRLPPEKQGPMPPDRIAALAEALETVMPDSVVRVGGPYAPLGSPEVTIKFDRPAFAAAILAALPPDFCGHSPEDTMIEAEDNWHIVVKSLADAEREIAHLRAELRVAHLDDTKDAEISRLRKIEEAAREIGDRSPLDSDSEGSYGDWCHYCQKSADYVKGKPVEVHEDWCDYDALRAALEADR